MYKCEVCGRKMNKKNSLYGYKVLCSKHMHQVFKFGHPIDNIARTQNDLNEYRIEGDTAIFDIYSGKNSNKIGEFIIDLEDIEKVKYHKWRISTHKYGTPHIITGLPYKGTQRDLSWVVLGIDNRIEDKVIDHINGNAFDNRKSNLRVCSQSENVKNKSFQSNNTSGFIGVSYRSDRKRWDPEIRYNYKRSHLGYTRSLEEAVYKRMFASTLLFKDFKNQEQYNKEYEFTKNLSQETKKELEKIVLKKLKSKGLWQ